MNEKNGGGQNWRPSDVGGSNPYGQTSVDGSARGYVQMPRQSGMMAPAQASPFLAQQQNYFGFTDPALQQRLFGALNEAGTNISHVPAGLGLPGQNFTFQHARFALSGPDLANLVSRHAAEQSNALGMVLNQPGVNPIYRPDFTIPGSHSQSLTALPMGAAMPILNNVQLQYPMGAQSRMIPNLNFTSVLTQRLPRNETSQSMVNGVNSQGILQMQANYGANGVASAKSAEGGHGMLRGSPRTMASDDGAHRRKRRKRDPTLPTPARFAWNFFFRDQYTKIRNSEPGEHSNVQKAFTDIGLDLGKKWKSLTKEEKAPYIKMAEMDRERYDREMRQRLNGVNSAEGSSEKFSGHEEHDNEEPLDDDDAIEDEEKVGIVLHEVEVEDKRDETEKTSDPVEGELVADVLVVDDDEVFLKIIRHRLIVGQKNPPKVITVTNASDAKRMILEEKKKFGTILMDKNLGEGQEDGLSSLQCIREQGYRGVVVGVTGSTDEKTRKDFAESGADNTFVKGSTSFYDDLLTLVKVHSTQAELMEKNEHQSASSLASESHTAVASPQASAKAEA